MAAAKKKVASTASRSSRSYPYGFLLPLLVAALVAYCTRDVIWPDRVNDDEVHVAANEADSRLTDKQDVPDDLWDYEEFKAIYPRSPRAEQRLTELSRRRILFNGNLLATGKHNIYYMFRQESDFVGQNPFIADRTAAEQADIMSQLEEFNLTSILEQMSLDRPVSGGGPALETGGKLDTWLTRVIKGREHFEIPNIPLDEQSDPERITHIDGDLRDCLGPIRNQMECGSCYAFSSLSLAEWHYCKQTGEKIDFSEQHLVDCGSTAHLDGCVGGMLPDVRSFMHLNGLHLEKDYPYKGKQRSCRKQAGSIALKTVDFTRVKVDRAEWEQILKEQPILVQVNLPADNMSYKRGVHPGTNCDNRILHGMLLVGHGRQDGVPYWILRNSMGENWGENGYLRLSRDAPMGSCFETGFVSKYRFRSVDEEKYRDFYDTINFEPTVQEEKKIVVNKPGLSSWLNRQ